jgi:hypothetical protein
MPGGSALTALPGESHMNEAARMRRSPDSPSPSARQRGHRSTPTACVLLVAAALFAQGTAGAEDRPVAVPFTFEPFVALGFAWIPNGDLNGIVERTALDLQAQGIPISPQVRFGGTLQVEAGFQATRIAGIALGFSFAYQYAPSHAGYSDYAGTMRIDGKLQRFEIRLVFAKELFEAWGRKVSLLIEPAFCRSYARLEETARYNSGQVSTSVWSGGSGGVSAIVGMCLPVLRGPMRVECVAGYGVIVGKYSREEGGVFIRREIDRTASANLGGSGPVILVRFLPFLSE